MIKKVTQDEIGIDVPNLPQKMFIVTLATLVALMAGSYMVGVIVTCIINTYIG